MNSQGPPVQSQNEDQKDQGISKQLRGSTLDLLPFHGHPGLPSFLLFPGLPVNALHLRVLRSEKTCMSGSFQSGKASPAPRRGGRPEGSGQSFCWSIWSAS